MTPTNAEFWQWRQEAENENTSGDRLAELAQISNELARIVAKNPNAPTEVLWKLGARFPQQLLDNPIFSLLFQEKQNLVDEIPFYTLYSLCTLEKIPVYLQEQLMQPQNLRLREEVAWHWNTSANILEWLALDNDAKVRWKVAWNRNTSASILEWLALDNDVEVRERVAKNSNTPASILELLAKDIDANVRWSAIDNLKTKENSIDSNSLTS